MSTITNAVLLVDHVRNEDHTQALLKPINAWLAERGQSLGFVSVEDEAAVPLRWYGGSGYLLECGMAVAAFNKLALGPLIAYLRGLDWAIAGDAVQLLVKQHEDHFFTLHTIFLPSDLTEPDWRIAAGNAYDAYGAVTDFKNFQGSPMPLFAFLPPRIQEAWIMAARDAYTAGFVAGVAKGMTQAIAP